MKLSYDHFFGQIRHMYCLNTVIDVCLDAEDQVVKYLCVVVTAELLIKPLN